MTRFYQILVLISILFFISCSYSDFTTYRIDDQDNFYNYYLFERNEENKNENLIVVLDGSTMHSSLGIKGSILPWKSFSAAYFFQKKLSKEFDLVVPERMNMEAGKDYSEDTVRLKEYTLEKRVETSVKCINEVIKKKNYQNIYILGYSEGGLILPMIYNSLNDQQSVKKLISIAAGGKSYYDLMNATMKEKGFNESYIDSIISEIKKYPNSVTKFAFGHPYNKWNSFLYYNPLEEFKVIEIPILVIHGEQDKNVSVEVSRFLKRKFDEYGMKNLTYIEIKNATHNFEEEADQVILEIEKFIRSNQ